MKTYDTMIDMINICNTNQEKINGLSRSICNILMDPAKNLGLSMVYRKGSHQVGKMSKKSRKSKPWFNVECAKACREYFKAINMLE